MNESKLIMFLLVALFSFSEIKAENIGKIEGKVKDKKTNEMIVGATVRIKGQPIGTITNFDGTYSIENLPQGVYNIEISFISYKTIIFEEVLVQPNKVTIIDADLEENPNELAEVVISTTRMNNTEIALINSIKSSQLVASGISGQQIQRTQDRDASEVVKRIPGITIQDNRFIVIRGLGQRYNNVWINNLAVPSSEADVKAFSFDVIPSSIIDNLVIYKTTSPELPAEFAGGFVKITTKDMPETNSVSASYSTSYNQNSTFEKGNTYQGGKLDWLGIDDGTRSLPGGMPQHLNSLDLSQDPQVKSQLTDVGKSFNQNWKIEDYTMPLDQRFSIQIARKNKSTKVKIGNITSFSYSNSNDLLSIQNNTFSIYNYSMDKPSYSDAYMDQRSTNSVKLGLLHNWSFLINKNFKIEFKNFLNNQGIKRTTEREGYEFYNDGRKIKSSELKFLSRTTYTGQIGSVYTSDDNNSTFDVNIGYALANKLEPDIKRYKYIENPTDSTRFMILFGDMSNPDLSSQSRIYLKLNEKIYSGSANYNRKIQLLNRPFEFQTGLYSELKNRTFTARNFGYSISSSNSAFSNSELSVEEIFTNQNINSTDGIKMMEITGKSDSYKAGTRNISSYVLTRFSITKQLFLQSGVRFENNNLYLNSYKQGQDIKIKVNRQSTDWFPTLNMTYNLNKKNLFRMAYGLSINRPEFREIAPFYFVDFELNAGIYGNPDLKDAKIHNFDFRYELYSSSNDILMIGGFYKSFKNPIEMIILGNNPMQYSFQNVDKSISYGIEVDARKSIFISGVSNSLTFVFNATLLRSKVTYAGNSLERNRAMQGQSPYIVNAGIYYNNSNYGFDMSLLYNVIGKRIIAVGRTSPNQWEDIPDVYEMPRNLLDFSISKKIGKQFDIKFGVKDILNEPVRIVQTVNTNVDMSNYSQSNEIKNFNREQLNKYYQPGRYFTFGINFKF